MKRLIELPNLVALGLCVAAVVAVAPAHTASAGEYVALEYTEPYFGGDDPFYDSNDNFGQGGGGDSGGSQGSLSCWAEAWAAAWWEGTGSAFGVGYGYAWGCDPTNEWEWQGGGTPMGGHAQLLIQCLWGCGRIRQHLFWFRRFFERWVERRQFRVRRGQRLRIRKRWS